jgi:hypothetical protein
MSRLSEISEKQNLLLLKLANELKDMLGVDKLDILSTFCEMEPDRLQQLRFDLKLAIRYYEKKLG